jgi:DNA-binding SARP family transcriptional activator/WD40 repeat protein
MSSSGVRVLLCRGPSRAGGGRRADETAHLRGSGTRPGNLLQAGRVLFSVLGPLMIEGEDARARLPGRKERTVLALLLARRGSTTSRAELVEALWAQAPPPSAARSLEAHVSRVRTGLPGAEVRRTRDGWSLHVPPDEIDAARFEAMAVRAEEAARSGAWVEALGLTAMAESLWRGRPFEGFSEHAACGTESERLDVVRTRVTELAVECGLALGRAPELVDRLRELVLEQPYREHRWVLLITALYRVGRQAEALTAYAEVRGLLRDELGVDPSPSLRRVHEQVLAHDPQLLAGLSSAAPAPAGPTTPYLALSAYGAQDAALFVGRERLVARVLARLGDHGVVALVGASGSGKSSVLHAGLLPALAAGGLAGSQDWWVEVVRPGARPDPAQPWPDLVVVDQLEEIFTLVDDEGRRRFAESLAEQAGRGVRVVVAVRADFWGRCSTQPALLELLGEASVLVGAPSEDELRRVVIEPARRLGVTVDPALADVVVTEVGQRDGALPLLSTALARAWNHRDEGRLTVADYRAAGGVSDAVGDLAEEVWSGLDLRGRGVARSMLVRLAVDGPEGLARQRVPADELVVASADPGGVLEHLVHGRLLVVREDGVEVVHESLFTAWPRLMDWLQEDADARRLRAHLTPAALEWERRGRRDEDLYTGVRLAETESWLDRADASLSGRERAFLEAGRRRADAARSAALERAAREARSARRLRVLLVVVATLLLVASVSGGVAWRAQDSAQRAEEGAVASRLGSEALLEPRPDLALLLAAQAVDLDPSPATRSSLFGTLLRFPGLVRVTQVGARVTGAGLTPDGSRLAVCTNLGELLLLDAETLTVDRTVVEPGGLSCSVPVFTDHGRVVTSVWQLLPEGAELRRYRVADGQLLRADPVPDGFFTYVSDDGDRMLTAAILGSYLWRRGADGWQRTPLGTAGVDVRVSGFGPDGLFAASEEARPVTVNRARDGEVLARLPGTRGLMVGEGVTSAGEVVLFREDGEVRLTDLRTGRVRRTLVVPGPVVFATLAGPHARLLVTTTLDGQVSVWRWRTGRRLLDVAATSGTVQAALSPDGATLYTAADDGTVSSWDVAGSRSFGRDVAIPQGVAVATYSGDGRAVALASPDGVVSALDPDDLSVTASKTLDGGVADLVPGAGSEVLVVTRDAVVVLDTSAGLAVTRRIPVPGAAGAAVAPDGRLAISSATDRSVAVVRPDGRIERVLPEPAAPFQVAWSPDASRLAVALEDSSVRLHDGSSGEVVGTVPGTADPVSVPIAFHDEDSLVIARRDGTLVTWDLADAAYRGDPVPATGGRPIRLVVSGDLAAVGSAGAGVGLVDVVAGLRYGGGLLPGGDEGLVGLLSPDGQRLTVVTASGSARQWPVSSVAWLDRACTVSARSLTGVEWRAHLAGRSYDPAC